MTCPPVLILGATSGMAEELARCFARAGHPLYLAARSVAALTPLVQDIKVRYQVDCTAHAFDILDYPNLARFMRSFDPAPHIIICAVGLLGDQAKLTRDQTAAVQVMNTNYIAPALAMAIAAERLAEIKAPTCLIGISSVAGDRGRAKNYYYGSAKAGFSAFLSGLRQQYARSRLHIMTVKPGFVATRMTDGMTLPAPLTLSATQQAALIFHAWQRRRDVVYHWKWWLVMTVIKLVPERLFKFMRF